MLRRILGSGKAQPKRPPDRWLVLPEGHEIDVVGESYHQRQLHTVEKALSAVGAKKQTAAVLFREPTNQYDRNAVAVARSARSVVALLRFDRTSSIGRTGREGCS